MNFDGSCTLYGNGFNGLPNYVIQVANIRSTFRYKAYRDDVTHGRG